MDMNGKFMQMLLAFLITFGHIFENKKNVDGKDEIVFAAIEWSPFDENANVPVVIL